MEMSRIPLYSRGRPLKNLLSDYERENKTILPLENSYIGLNTYGIGTMSEDVQKLYAFVIRKWYFSEIGFDTDDEFIYRFGGVFWKYYPTYSKYANMLLQYEKDIETLDIKGENERTMENVETPNLTDSIEIRKTGNIEYEKGVTTTSEQNTQNTGNKLTRSTPNEDMSVTGEATNTVADSGSNKDIFDTVDTHSERHTGTNTKTGSETLSVDTSNERSKLTTSNLLDYQQVLDIMERFVYKFENLFMEVL